MFVQTSVQKDLVQSLVYFVETSFLIGASVGLRVICDLTSLFFLHSKENKTETEQHFYSTTPKRSHTLEKVNEFGKNGGSMILVASVAGINRCTYRELNLIFNSLGAKSKDRPSKWQLAGFKSTNNIICLKRENINLRSAHAKSKCTPRSFYIYKIKFFVSAGKDKSITK